MAAYAPVAILDLTSEASTRAETRPTSPAPEYQPVRRSNPPVQAVSPPSSHRPIPQTPQNHGTERLWPKAPRYPKDTTREEKVALGWTTNDDNDSVEREREF